MRTAEMVESKTGKKPARKMITIAGTSPMPINSTIKGIQATGAIGRIICKIGLIYPYNGLNHPIIKPKIAAETTDVT